MRTDRNNFQQANFNDDVALAHRRIGRDHLYSHYHELTA